MTSPVEDRAFVAVLMWLDHKPWCSTRLCGPEEACTCDLDAIRVSLGLPGNPVPR